MAQYRDKTTSRPVDAFLFDGSVASVHALMSEHPDVWWERGSVRVRSLPHVAGSTLVPPGRWIVRDPKDNSLSAFEAERFDERFEPTEVEA